MPKPRPVIYISLFAMGMLCSLLCSPALSTGPALKKTGSAPASSAATAAPAAQFRPIKDKWAVVIGIDTFKDPSIPHLKFSAKDATDFAKFLVEQGNFEKDHVLLLCNEKASRDNIRDAIGGNWLPRRVAEDDLVVIFASTHGSPKDIDVARENFLVAYDSDPQNLYITGIRFADLAPEIKNRTGCDRVVLLLDACNSGAANVGGKGLTRTINFDVNGLAGEGQIVISSSSADQRSFESKRYENGVFTRQLISALQSKGSKMNIKEAFDCLKEQVENEVRFDRELPQTPVMRSKWIGGELVLTAVPSQPRHVESGVPKLRDEANLDANYERAKPLFDSKKYEDAVPLLISSASSGHSLSQNLLAVCYQNGFGVSKDSSRALELFQKAASQGLPRAQRNLGSAYLLGLGVPKNYEQALEWYQKAAEQGDKESFCSLGNMYKMGLGVLQNYSKAFEWFQKAADQGLARAQFNMGLMYENGLGVPQNYGKALEFYQKAVDQGNIDGQYALGAMYENGRGTQPNPSKAVELYQKAAEQGDAESQFNLGSMYDNGNGVTKNQSKAAELYQKAAEQGLANAQYYLGILYESGTVLPQNLGKAVEWYQKAAEQGHAESQCHLGQMFDLGKGVAQNQSKAVEWYQKSAAQGFAFAQWSLGFSYEIGSGIKQDYGKAVEWYQKAADQGNARSQFNLGRMYKNGWGVKRDPDKALELYRKSASQGFSDAKAALSGR